MLENYNSKRLKQWFWAVVATVILGTLVYMSDLEKMISALRHAEPGYIVLSLVFGFSGFLLWSVNWHNFFKISNIDAGLARTFQLFAASRFLNLVTPLGQFGGQPVMAYLVAKESNASYEKSLATLSSADLIVIMPVTVYILLGYFYLSLTSVVPGQVHQASTFASGLALFGLFMGYMGWRRPAILKDILFMVFSKVDIFTGKDSDLVDKIDQFLTNLEDSYRRIGQNPFAILKSFILVHIAYLFKILAFFVITLALGMNMSFFHALLVIPLVSIANFSPTPGGTGAVEAALAGLIVLVVNVNLSAAVLATLLYRVATYWLGVVVGYISMATLEFNADEYTRYVS